MNIALFVRNPQNRRLIEEALGDECRFLSRKSQMFAGYADLVIVDGPALAGTTSSLRRLKKRADPVFLPVLFISGRRQITRSVTAVWDDIDDVIAKPLVKRELQARVRALLRARRLSLSLRSLLKNERDANERLRATQSLYERSRTIADTFQHAALPRALPVVPGFEFDGYYEPAGNQAQIGGDWYDAMSLNDGRLVVSVGDVAGTGLNAAVTMVSMRQAIRAVGQVYADPLTMLDAADRTLKEEQPEQVVTAFVGVLDPVTQTITYASAGHPPPMLRHPDGTVQELVAQSLPLGLRIRGDGMNGVAELRPDSMLVFFTDGLSEVTRDYADGERRLRAALADGAICRAEHPALSIKQAVYDGRVHEDDIAVLTLHMSAVDESAGVQRWFLHSGDADEAVRIRNELVNVLRERGVPAEGLFGCELIFGELLGNVVRYAPGKTEIVLDTGGSAAVLHMLDFGRGFTLVPRLPTDLLSERGRGLFLIWTLSSDFNVDMRPGGGAHARVVLPVEMTGAPSRLGGVDGVVRGISV